MYGGVVVMEKTIILVMKESVFLDIEEAMVFHNRDGVAMKTIMIAKTDSNRVGDNN